MYVFSEFSFFKFFLKIFLYLVYVFGYKLFSFLIEILIVKFLCSELKLIFCFVNDIIIERVL